MRRLSLIAAAAVLGACVSAQAVENGPVTITGHVSSNTLISGRLLGVPVGAPVTMIFKTVRGGFNPFWGPTGHFCNVDEESFELHVGAPTDERISYTAANNTSILYVNAGFVTTAVNQDVMEFFQMSLDSPGYSVYFKAQDLDASVGWTTPLVCGLPASTPSSAFDAPSGSWWVRQTTTAPVDPAPEMDITFDGTITVAHTECRADYNEDGIITVQDIFDFLSGWFLGCNGSQACNGHFADANCSNTIEVQDIFDFLSIWFAGC